MFEVKIQTLWRPRTIFTLYNILNIDTVANYRILQKKKYDISEFDD